MTHGRPQCTPRVPNTRPVKSKPFTTQELIARTSAEQYLLLAQDYRARGDTLNAISCCLEALEITAGLSRPLAVRDQVIDLLRVLDPISLTSSDIRLCTQKVWTSDWLAQTQRTRLEHLVSAHQLMRYPSDDTRFNAAYEQARWYLRKNRPQVDELYIVAYTSGLVSRSSDRYFSFVPSAMISAHGPHYLTDICAVVRR